MTNCFCFFLLSEIKENAISKQTPVWQVYGIASIKISHHSSCSWGYILGKSNIVSPSVQFSSVQSLTCIRLPVTPWTAGCQVYLSITNSQSPPKPMSMELVTPSKHLILCNPLLLLPSIFPSIRVFSNESALPVRWPKYWSFSFSISPSNEYSVLISLRMDWLDLLAVQGTRKSLIQHHSSKASILRRSTLFMAQFSHPYMTIGKTIALTRWTFVGKWGTF